MKKTQITTPPPESESDSNPLPSDSTEQRLPNDSPTLTSRFSRRTKKVKVEGEINAKSVMFQTAAAILLLVSLLIVCSIYLKEPMESSSKEFIQWAGVWGVGLGFFLPDAFTLPIPPDTFLVAGYLGGLNFWSILVWASVGSVLGGSVGFLLIRSLSSRPNIRKWLDRKINKGRVFMERYGLLALGIGALTPLPYSIMCWACGAMGVRFLPFLAVSLLRIPRVAIYLFIIEKTMVSIS